MAVIVLSLLLIPVQTAVMAWSRLLFFFSWFANCPDISAVPLGVSGNDKTLLLGKQRIWTQWIGSPVFWLPARQTTTVRSSSCHFSLRKPSSIAPCMSGLKRYLHKISSNIQRKIRPWAWKMHRVSKSRTSKLKGLLFRRLISVSMNKEQHLEFFSKWPVNKGA